MKKFEDQLGQMVLKSVTLITNAVENAAAKNAQLFSKTVQILRNVTKIRPMKEKHFEKILKGKSP